MAEKVQGSQPVSWKDSMDTGGDNMHAGSCSRKMQVYPYWVGCPEGTGRLPVRCQPGSCMRCQMHGNWWQCSLRLTAERCCRLSCHCFVAPKHIMARSSQA